MLLIANGARYPSKQISDALKTTTWGGTSMYDQKKHNIGDRLTLGNLELRKRGIIAQTIAIEDKWEKQLLSLTQQQIYPIAHLRIKIEEGKPELQLGCAKFRTEDSGHDVIILSLDSTERKIYFLDPMCTPSDGMDLRRCYNNKSTPDTFMTYQMFERLTGVEMGNHITLIYRKRIRDVRGTLEYYSKLGRTGGEK